MRPEVRYARTGRRELIGLLLAVRELVARAQVLQWVAAGDTQAARTWQQEAAALLGLGLEPSEVSRGS